MQDYIFFKSQTLGNAVALDDDIQSSEVDEFIYHEALVHPAMLLADSCKKVLICGGGEGATLREVIRHSDVEKAVMCDIDREFIDLCKKHLPQWNMGSFNSEKAVLIYEDINKYLNDQPSIFDVIISDLVDMAEDEQEYTLYTQEFFSNIYQSLSDSGIFVSNAFPLDYMRYKRHNRLRKRIGEVFPYVYSYRVHVPSFYANWSFILAAKNRIESLEIIQSEDINFASEIQNCFADKYKERNLNLRHFLPLMLYFSFLIPPEIKSRLVSTDI